MCAVPSDWRRHVRPQDFVWLALFAALAIFSPGRGPVVLAALIAMGAVQVLEPYIGARTAIVLNLLLCYPLIYYSELYPVGISSGFWVMLLLPVISAATNFDLPGSTIVVVVACLEDLSFLLFIEYFNRHLPPGERELYVPQEEQFQLALRVLSLLLVSYLTHQLAKGKREEAARYQKAAEDLAAANENLKRAEAEVRRSERLAALGQLTAGLAHELRNPMGTMKTSAEMLARSVPEDNAIAREMAGYITEEVDRTNSLITRFLDFARPQHLKIEKGDLAATLDRAIDRFERERSRAAEGVTVFKNYSPDIPPVAFDAELMERVFYNLVMNAAQASPAGAVVTVKARRVQDKDEEKVEVAVIDRGSGIEAKDLESIFNPFFTTKPEGVGLGLAIVSKIVDEHRGQMTVESSVGEGSVFRVFLPIE
jgi:two-component system, NtrC family, sensor histidine kinase HydH